MRFLLRLVLLIPLLLCFLIFGSLHWEESTTDGGQHYRSFRVGLSQSPWFEYEKSYTHESQLDALLTLGDEMLKKGKELEEDGGTSQTVSFHSESNSSWRVNLLSWSWAFGFATLLLLYFYCKLKKPIKSS